MTNFRTLAAVFALLAAAVAAPSHAGIFRAYLSIAGNDANPCTITAPCRLLPAALAAANDGGEVWMLDSANCNTGPVLIDKAIKILAIPGEVGSIVGNGGDGLVINAPGKDVTLRNLVVLNLSGGINGIHIQGAAAVHMDKLTVHDFNDPAGACIKYASVNGIRVWLNDSSLHRCRAAIHIVRTGITIEAFSSFIVDNTRIERDFSANTQLAGSLAVLHEGCVDFTLRNSVISRQGTGLELRGYANCFYAVNVVDSTFTRMERGLLLGNSAGGGISVVMRGSQIHNTSASAIEANLSSPSSSSEIVVDMLDSSINSCVGCVRLNNTGAAGSAVRLRMYGSTVGNDFSQNMITTAGIPGGVLFSATRSNFHGGIGFLSHGAGSARFDACHIESFTTGFVNAGSGDVISMGNNSVLDVANPPGPAYISPSARSQI